MCGIWALIGTEPLNAHNAFKRVSKRGPDRSYYINYGKPYYITLGFHRLSIMDPSVKGDQPFSFETENVASERILHLICNGEIYNFKKLVKKYNVELKSGSDCEVILHLYMMNLGMDKIMEELRGEFAFVIFDIEKASGNMKVFASRDPFGIRPMFMYKDDSYVNFSSELKGLVAVYNKETFAPSCVKIVKPAHYLEFDRINGVFTEIKEHKYYVYPDLHEQTYPPITDINYLEDVKQKIRNTFTESVRSKLIADRPLGALLSGGLDSSLICGIASKLLKESGRVLKTFSVGMEGSTDEHYAKMASEYIGSEHTHIQFEQQDWLDALKHVIYTIETFDITTIRASTGQYLISKWIAENTDIKVLLIGDGSDELCSGYMYFHNAPSSLHAHYENILLLDEIGQFDVLRADRGIASNGLEARVPFLDVDFVSLYLSINPDLRVPINGVEKWLLRESFKESGVLPAEVLFRKKEAFSDGVSSVKKSWFKIIQEHAESQYSDAILQKKQKEYTHCSPPTKEALYYRECFESYFGKNVSHIIPHYWLPKWSGNITEPSARVLSVYAEKS